MKKVISVFLLIVTLCSCSELFYDYDGWQTVTIDGIGTLKLPAEWMYYYDNDLMHITDEDGTIIAIQSESFVIYHEGTTFGKVESNSHFKEVQQIESMGGTQFSNCADYGYVKMIADGSESENLRIRLRNSNSAPFQIIFWDETVTEDLVAKIAWSFSREMDE